MTDKEKIELIIIGVSSVGTLILAALAIFGDTVKKWFYKSNLSFEIENKEPFVIECNTKEIFSDDTSTSIAINLRIRNVGNISAINAQLYTEKIFRVRQENQTYYLDREVIPANFLWKNESELKSLTPLMSHYVEIARIQQQIEYTKDVQSNKEIRNSRDVLFLSIPDSTMSGEFIKLGKGTYLIPIKAYADSMGKENEIYIEIFWNANDLKHKSNLNFYVKQVKRSELSNEVTKHL
ncbi:MAG: hypothetical protein RLZ33_2190 [Bacteroidota bacterium]|jgi:hypothetical protein